MQSITRLMPDHSALRFPLLCLLLTLVSAGLVFGQDIPQEIEPAYPNGDLLVDSDWLAGNLDFADLIVADVRDLSDYSDAHIPGAVRVDSASLNVEVDHVADQVADAETAAEILGDLGITPDKTVIVYDAGTSLYAARLFWILEYYGYPDVRLLDGGWTAWSEADQPTQSAAPDLNPVANLKLTPVEELKVEGEWINENLEDGGFTLIDARSASEYAAGHIPGALNFDWHMNLRDGMFLSPTELAAKFTALGVETDQPIIVYCSLGYRASVDYFALRLLGYEDITLYDGSWAEWSAHDEWPVETGAS
ncbi:MAG: sulfurtransferase [Chloroflexota bacterium]